MFADTPYAITPTDTRNEPARIRPVAMPNPDRDFAQLDALTPEERVRLLSEAVQRIGVV